MTKAKTKNGSSPVSNRTSRRKVLTPYEVPFVFLNRTIVFPFALTPLVIEDPNTIEVAEKASNGNRLIALFPEKPSQNDEDETNLEIHLDCASFDVAGKQACEIGVVARIVKLLKFPDGGMRILIRGLKRVRFVELKGQTVVVNDIPPPADPDKNDIELLAMIRNLMDQFQELITISPHIPEELKIAIFNINDHERILDLIADTININYLEKIAILTLPTLNERLQLLTILLNRELEVAQLGSEIQTQVHQALGQSQREVFLREQLHAIKKELGEDTQNPDIVKFKKRLKEQKLPQHILETVTQELERLEMIHQASGEYHIVHAYIDWLISMPWSTFTDDQLDVKAAAKILDEDHYNLKDVKERILEFLAVLQLKKSRKAPILCFVGPPGVGKTSLGQSIAKAMNRKFVRMSLGGVRDEAEIRGHRRTYIGALPGRIIQGIKRAGVNNPVFMLDEIDKLSSDFRGDPSSALLEVLDPEQNKAFSDHYLELDYDLSSVMFIATANILDPIPPALLDRMEVIRISGYTTLEKKQIAKRFLLPRQLKENGLKKRQLTISLPALETLIHDYTREAGVRNLDRSIGSLCRKVARKIVEKAIPEDDKTSITPEQIEDYLGPKTYFMDEAENHAEIGLAIGMAWTSVGGVILPVESTMVPGKGDLKLTGSLGDVMKESALAAFSHVKSQAEKLKIDIELFRKHDFHVHVPDGATPKDGPSAGVTIAVSLISLLTQKPLKPLTAMTGEITLLGRITPVGGIKEKIIAALRAGVKTVLLPAKNKKDLVKVPDEVNRKLKFHFIEHLDDALKHLL